MSIKRPRPCVSCGVPLQSTNATVRQCGKCAQKRYQMPGYTYTRTHVHTWPNGERTMSPGIECVGVCERIPTRTSEKENR